MTGRPSGFRYAGILLLALLLALTLKAFVVDAVSVPSGSMEPSILRGDFLLLDKTGFSPSWLGSRTPSRGDVVAFAPPEGAGGGGALIVKRCVASEGDTVSWMDGAVVVNGRVAVPGPADRGEFFRDGAPRVVPPESIFVMGDNQAVSLDSRSWGFIPVRSVVGKAAMIYWSRADDGSVRWPRVCSLVR